MDLTKFKLCAGCSTEDLEIYHHEADGRTAHRRKRIDGYMGPLIEGEPPGVVRGKPRLNGSGLLALLMAGALTDAMMEAERAKSQPAKGEDKAPETAIRSLTDAVERMNREKLSILCLSPEEAAGIEDAPEAARARGLILSREDGDLSKSPGDFHGFLFGRGEVLRVFLPFEAKAEKGPEAAAEPAAPAPETSLEFDQGGIVNPPPIKSLGIHLCPDGGVVVTEWPQEAPWPPSLFASRSNGHAMNYALKALKEGRQKMRAEARAAGEQEPPIRPVIMGVDLAKSTGMWPPSDQA